MQQRVLGNTGISTSLLGLGTVKFGRDKGVKYPKQFTIPDDKTSLALLRLALEQGINLLDTAPAYGSSEEKLGRLLSHFNHDDFLLCSKAGEEFEIDEAGNPRSFFDFSPQHLRRSIERSLKRLGRQQLDIFLIHSNGDDVQLIQQQGVLETLNGFKKEGLIRASGMSTKTLAGGQLAAQQSDVVMLSLNIQEQQELPILKTATLQKSGVFIKKALASGHLSTANYQTSLQDNFSFLKNQAAVSSIIVGTINPEHLLQNIAAVNAA